MSTKQASSVVLTAIAAFFLAAPSGCDAGTEGAERAPVGGKADDASDTDGTSGASSIGDGSSGASSIGDGTSGASSIGDGTSGASSATEGGTSGAGGELSECVAECVAADLRCGGRDEETNEWLLLDCQDFCEVLPFFPEHPGCPAAYEAYRSCLDALSCEEYAEFQNEGDGNTWPCMTEEFAYGDACGDAFDDIFDDDF